MGSIDGEIPAVWFLISSIGFLIFSPLALLLFTAEIYSLVFSQFQIGPFYGYEPE